MKLILPVLCDALAAYAPQIIAAKNLQTDGCLDGQEELLVLSSGQSVSEHELRDRLVLILGGAALPEELSSARAVIRLDATLPPTQLRKLLYDTKLRYDSWNHRLLSAVIRQSKLDSLVSIGAEVFDCPIQVKNYFGQVLSTGGSWGSKEQEETTRTDFYPQVELRQFATLCLMKPDAELTDGERYLLNHFASLLERYFECLGSGKVGYPLEILEALLSKEEIDRSFVEFHLNQQGWRMDDGFLVLVASHRDNRRFTTGELKLFAEELKQQFGQPLLYSTEEKILLIINRKYAPPIDAAQKMVEEFARRRSVDVGISSVFPNFMHLNKYYQEALYALKKAPEHDAGPCVLRYENVQGLFLEEYLLRARDVYGDISSPLVRQLAQLERDTGQPYIRTLYEYLLSGSNISSAARKLFIDRTTLLYRLKKISEIFQFDISKESLDDVYRFYCLISCYLVMKSTETGKRSC